jgi:glycosyltransferase involved in cell wall biosynthesis
VKLLVVGDSFPWPPVTGGTIRLSNAVEALAELGDLDLFTFYDAREPERNVPPHVQVTRTAETPYLPLSGPRRRRARWLMFHGAPFEVAIRCAEPRARIEFTEWVDDQYDLVWFSSIRTYEWLGRPELGPTIVDFIDLEDVKERQRADLIAGRHVVGLAARIRRRAAEYVARRNAADWERIQVATASRVACVVLSSGVDAARSGIANAAPIINAYPDPGFERGDGTAGAAGGALGTPTLVFQGTFDYLPNVDGAEWLVRDIGPRIRAAIPDARIRLVGRKTPVVARLDAPPQVMVVGFVPDMGREMAVADVGLVPLRRGSGTRLKILESFAYGVPVVSTSLGAEGLDVVDGVHLLLADDPLAFADAVVRLCGDEKLRSSLIEAGRMRFLEHYESAAARRAVRELARSVAPRK